MEKKANDINLIQSHFVYILIIYKCICRGTGGSMSQVVGSNSSYKPITNTACVRAQLCKLQKGCTRLTTASDKVYQLFVQGLWFSPDTPASSITKTGRHDIAEILLKVALNTKGQIQILIEMYMQVYFNKNQEDAHDSEQYWCHQRTQILRSQHLNIFFCRIFSHICVRVHSIFFFFTDYCPSVNRG